MLGHFALLLIFILLGLLNLVLLSPRIKKVNKKMKSYLFWNGFIRLFMELYAGLALSTVLNLQTSEDDWESIFQWVEVSYWSARVSFLFLAVLPLLFFVPLLLIKRDEWSNKAFKRKYGDLLDGTRIKLRKKET